MSKTLTEQDLKAIGKEVLSAVENCLKNMATLQATNVNDLMTVDDVCDKLKLKKQTVYKLLRKYQIKSIKIGKQFYVKTVDFNDYIKSKY